MRRQGIHPPLPLGARLWTAPCSERIRGRPSLGGGVYAPPPTGSTPRLQSRAPFGARPPMNAYGLRLTAYGLRLTRICDSSDRHSPCFREPRPPERLKRGIRRLFSITSPHHESLRRDLTTLSSRELNQDLRAGRRPSGRSRPSSGTAASLRTRFLSLKPTKA